MKIKSEHYEHMKLEIEKLLEINPQAVNKYENGNFKRSANVKDLQKRFCFDIAQFAGLDSFFCDTLYGYMNDDHIYTALKAICPTVTRKY